MQLIDLNVSSSLPSGFGVIWFLTSVSFTINTLLCLTALIDSKDETFKLCEFLCLSDCIFSHRCQKNVASPLCGF